MNLDQIARVFEVIAQALRDIGTALDQPNELEG